MTDLAESFGAQVPSGVTRLHAVALLGEQGKLILPFCDLVRVLPVAVAVAVVGLPQQFVRVPDDRGVFLLQDGDAALDQEIGHPDEEQQRSVQDNHRGPPIGLWRFRMSRKGPYKGVRRRLLY